MEFQVAKLEIFCEKAYFIILYNNSDGAWEYAVSSIEYIGW